MKKSLLSIKKGDFQFFKKKHNSNIEEAKKFFKYGIIFEESPLLPKNPLKKWFVKTFMNNKKIYEDWIKYFTEKPNINFKYFSTMFK